MSGGKGPVIPSPSRNKEAGKAKVIIYLLKLLLALIWLKKKIKTLREIIFFFT